MSSGPGNQTELDVTTVTDPRKIVIGRTTSVDLRMTVTDIEKIDFDQPMTTTNTITTGRITTNQDIHDMINDLPITIAALGPLEIIDDPRIIDATTVPASSLNELANSPSLKKTRLVHSPTPR